MLTCTGPGGTDTNTLLVYVGNPLPPDPGSGHAQTLEGIDADGDGVRDDLEHYIAATHPASQRTRESLLQLAAEYHVALAVRASQSSSRQHAQRILNAVECIELASPDAPDAAVGVARKFTNTVDRLRAYSEFDTQLVGGVFGGAALGKAACEFSIDALPN